MIIPTQAEIRIGWEIARAMVQTTIHLTILMVEIVAYQQSRKRAKIRSGAKAIIVFAKP